METGETIETYLGEDIEEEIEIEDNGTDVEVGEVETIAETDTISEEELEEEQEEIEDIGEVEDAAEEAEVEVLVQKRKT